MMATDNIFGTVVRSATRAGPSPAFIPSPLRSFAIMAGRHVFVPTYSGSILGTESPANQRHSEKQARPLVRRRGDFEGSAKRSGSFFHTGQAASRAGAFPAVARRQASTVVLEM